jgi:hypothetical protein
MEQYQPMKYILSMWGFLVLMAYPAEPLRAQDQDYQVYHLRF